MGETATSFSIARVREHVPPWSAMILIGLFAVVLAASATVADMMVGAAAGAAAGHAVGVETAQSGGATLAGGWAVLQAAAVGAILAIAAAHTRLPPDWQIIAEYLARTVVGIYATWLLAPAVGIYPAAGLVLAGYVAMQLLDEMGVFWPFYDLAGVSLAVAGAVVVGHLFSPAVFVAIAAVLAAWDHWAADRRSHMFAAAGSLIRWRVPVAVVVPESPQLRLLSFANRLTTQGPDSITASALGTGDFLLAGAFVASLVVAGTASVAIGAVAVAGTVGLAGAFAIPDGGGAGLPWIFGGMVPAWALVVVVG